MTWRARLLAKGRRRPRTPGIVCSECGEGKQRVHRLECPRGARVVCCECLGHDSRAGEKV